MSQSLDTELRIRDTEQRVVRAQVVFQICVICLPKQTALVKLFWLPGKQPVFDLLGKSIGIGGRTKCFSGENTGSLVISVAVVRRTSEAGDDDVRAELANHSHQIAEGGF